MTSLKSSLAGDALRQRRTRAGLTREQLAVRAGLATRTLQRIELGQARPHRATVAALLAALPHEVEQEPADEP